MKYYLGIDLGGTNIVAGVADENYKILAKHSAKTTPELSFPAMVARMADTAKTAVEKAGLRLEDMQAIGLGTPSCINPANNCLVYANNLGWKNVPLYDEMKKHFNIPLFIRNDADCAALGEVLAGAARDYRDALMVTLGTGVGGGIIINRRIFSGGDNMGAEIGHTKLVYDGVPCTCGQRGCLEAYASATALINQTREAILRHPESALSALCGGDLDKVDAKTAFDGMRRGDAVAAALVDRYISYLSAGLSTLVCVLRPQVIILGGGVSNERETLLAPLREKLRADTFSGTEIGVPPVIVAALGNDAGLIGAAFLCEMNA